MSERHTAPAHRLRDAASAYLRSASEQDIEWYPWGEEAFAVALEKGRPVLLDIGGGWCHWCHVMDEGTYSDPEVARLLREGFVAVKVDRDENPEVDRRYQQQVHALSGEGGWPLTAFLTPQGEAFLGGTYFPPTDGHGRPGFRRVLREVARLWREERAQLKEQAASVAEGMRAMHAREHEGSPELPAFVEGTLERCLQQYDPSHGGFGGAPKFPHPTAVALLLEHAHRTGDTRSAEAARRTLRGMADGGVFDQLEGGFHRYSVDEGWRVPHFEKMAIDNAHLLPVFLDGWNFFDEPRFGAIASQTVAWVMAVLGRDPKGGFGASQDADNAPGDDGSYFTWTSTELKSLLAPEEFQAIRWRFGLDGEACMPHDPSQNVLQQLFSEEEVAKHLQVPVAKVRDLSLHAMEKMRRARSQRPEPAVDPAKYASLNGLLIGALALAGRALGQEPHIERARASADRFLAGAFDPARGIAHVLGPRGGEGWGLLQDQCDFALGLLSLSEVTGEGRYLERARDLLQLARREFTLGPEGPLRDLAPQLYDGPKVGAWEGVHVPVEDTPHLSANASYLLASLHLSALTGAPGVPDGLGARLAPIVSRVQHGGLFAAGSALACALFAQPALRVVVEGEGPEAEALWRAAVGSYHPRKVLFRGAPSPPFALPEEVLGQTAGSNGRARALLCRGTVCRAPIVRPEELRAAIRSEGGAARG